MREDTITQCLQEINTAYERGHDHTVSSGDKHSIMREDSDHTVSSGDKHSIMREDVIIQCLQEINTAL